MCGKVHHCYLMNYLIHEKMLDTISINPKLLSLYQIVWLSVDIGLLLALFQTYLGRVLMPLKLVLHP